MCEVRPEGDWSASSAKRKPDVQNERSEFCTSFSGLAKVAFFTTNVDAENQCLINHKCACGALNRHFCQTRVSGMWLFHFYLFALIMLIPSVNIGSSVSLYFEFVKSIRFVGLKISLGVPFI